MPVNKVLPDYEKAQVWELYSKELLLEYKQSIEEGKDISSYEELFKAVSKMPSGEQKEKMSEVIFDIVLNSGQVPDYKYNEPSDLEDIRAFETKV